MDFGLGLVVSLTDRASAGLVGISNTLGSLQAVAESSDSTLGKLGQSLTALGSLGRGMTTMITTPIMGFLGKITKYGIGRASFIEDMHLAFSSLMGDAQKASDYMQSMLNFAKTTPYTYEGIASAAQILISYGVDMEDILSGIDTDMDGIMDAAKDGKSYFGGMLQAIGDWAGATGRGESAFSQVAEIMGKINSEGKIGSMRLQQLELAGIQASKIIGNMYGMAESEAREFIKTMEPKQFFKDLVKGLEEGTDGVNGMTGAMAGQMMELKKTWTGAKDTFVSALKTAGLSLMGAYKDEYGVSRYKFLDDMRDSLNRISDAVKLIPSILQPTVDVIQNFMVKGSEAIKKFATAWANLPDPIKKTIGKIVATLTLLGPALLIVSKVGGGVINILTTLKTVLGAVGSPLRKFSIALGLFALAWKTDFLGIRTIITDFATNVKKSFDKADDALSGDVNHMREVIKGLNKDNAWDNFTLGLIKLKTVWQSLKEGWNGFTLSEDTFQKIDELGLRPLVERFFDLKYRFDQFKEGFIEGWNEIKTKVITWWNNITSALKGTFIGDALDKLTGFLTKLTNNDPDAWKNAGKSFSKIATGLIALWGAVKLFKGISKIFGGGKEGGGIISKVKSILGIGTKGGTSAKESFLSNPKQVLKTMGSLAIILGGATLLVTAIGAFMSIPHFKDFASAGFDSVKQMFENLIPLGATIGGLGLLAKGFEVLKISPKTAAKGIADFAILLGGMDVLITAMGALNSIPGFDNFLNTGVDVINRLFGVLKSMFDIEILTTIGLIGAFGFVPVKTAASGIANLALIIGGLDVLITAMGALDSIEGFDNFLNKGVDTINKLFGVLRSMFDISILGTVGAISAFGLVPVGVTVTGLGNLALVLGGMTGIISAFSALGSIEGFDDFIDRGGDTLAKLFGQVGKIVGEVVAQFGESATSTLPSIGENLSGFMTKAETFFTQIQEVDTDKVSSFMTSFADLAGTLTGDKLVSLLTGETDYAELGTKLSDFGTNSKGFFDTVKDFPDEAFTNAGKMFAALNGLDQYSFKSGGIAQLFTGEVSFDKIGEQINSFTQSGALDFFTQIEGISDEAFTSADQLFKSLAGLDAYQFKSGGLAQFFTGEVAFDKIGEQMNSFTQSGALDFFTQIEGISDEAFGNADKLFKSLNGLDGYQFKSGGLAQFFTGEVAFDKIGAQLKSFSDVGASDFFTAMEGISDTAFDNADKMFKSLNGLDQYQFKSGGLAQLITGDTAFDKIGAQLKSFSDTSGDFFTQMSGLSEGTFDNVDSLFKSLQGLDKYEFKTGGIAQWFTGEVNFGNIGTNLGDFARNSEDFFTKLGTYDESTFTKVNSAMGVFDALGKNKAGLKLFSGRGALFGGNNAANVGRNLSDFARESETFFTKMANINTEAVSNFSTAIDALSDLSYIHNTGNLTAMGDDLSKCAEAIGGFVSVFKGESFDVSALTTVTESISSLSTSISTVNTDVGTAITSITTNLTSLGTSFTEMSTNAGTAFSTMASTISTTMSTIYLGLNTQWNSIISYTATAGASMVSAASSAFNSMKASISSIMSSAVSTVKSSVSAMESAVAGMTFKVSQTHIALPHFKASGSFSANPPSVPTFSVSWYKKGGIFDNPSIIGVGEQGKEAVMPLEKNTQWIGILADRISNALESSSVNLSPINTTPVGKTSSDAPITRNVSNTTYGGDTDNSVVFQNGAIQLNCQNTSEEEAMRLAKKIMYYIERQTQLKSMAMYNT